MEVCVERLSAQDALFLYAEDAESPMHVGAFALLEGKPLRDASGRLDLERVALHYAARLGFAPNFLRRLVDVPLGLGHPVWVDDARFDIREHVREKVLPRPVTMQSLYAFVEELQSQPLPRDRPLWDLWLVDGLEGDRIAIIQRLHHAMTDGVSAVQFAALLYDFEAKPKYVPQAPVHVPSGAPWPWQLIAQAMRHQTNSQRDLVTQSLAAARNKDWSQALGLARLRGLTTMLLDAPRSILTVQTPSHARRWQPVTTPLAPLVAYGRGLSATLNDVVLALVLGAVTRYCREHGEAPAELHTWMPISTRRAGAGSGGNQWSGVPVRLPAASGSLSARVAAIKERTRKVKASAIASDLRELSASTEAMPAPIQRRFARTRLGCGARNLHLSVSNVPGPVQSLYMLGARVLEVHPFSIVAYHSALSVTTLSYGGRLSFGLSAQAEGLPEFERLVTLLEDELLLVPGVAPSIELHSKQLS